MSPDVWLSYLTKKEQTDQQNATNLAVYGSLVGAAFIFVLIRAFAFHLATLRCSERLHDKMVAAVIHTPILFFDTNPVGRILNRFSKDVGCMDELLPKIFLSSLQLVLLLLASTVVPAVANFWVVFIILPLALIGAYIVKYYLQTSRELKRLESICRSPVFSHISETLNGLDTIRTRGKQTDFLDQFYRQVRCFCSGKGEGGGTQCIGLYREGTKRVPFCALVGWEKVAKFNSLTIRHRF